MRTAMLGALVGAGLAIAAVGAAPNRGEGIGQRLGTYDEAKSAGDLIALSTVVGDRYQQVTVIDPKLRAISVYHVELASGEVELCCVRDIRWDLQMEYFNGKGLSPVEIRSMLEPR
ncbi:MAG: hypothetical protein ABIK89_02980 [Planctomycetota bacterium]